MLSTGNVHSNKAVFSAVVCLYNFGEVHNKTQELQYSANSSTGRLTGLVTYCV
jgi:hypothetical protein